MKSFLFSLCFSLMLLSGTVAFAADVYQPIVNIPGITNLEQVNTNQYVNALYRLSITVAALMAVVKIIFGGVKWMLSDVVTDKSSAKKDIKGALLGLLIVLAAVLILNTINTDLTKINFLGNAPSLEAINAIGAQESKEPVYTPATIGSRLQSGTATNEAITNFKTTCPGQIKQQPTRGGVFLVCSN